MTGYLREGYTVVECKEVIDTKVKVWINDPRWQQYLRPSTLFKATNVENYLEQARSKNFGTKTIRNFFRTRYLVLRFACLLLCGVTECGSSHTQVPAPGTEYIGIAAAIRSISAILAGVGFLKLNKQLGLQTK